MLTARSVHESLSAAEEEVNVADALTTAEISGGQNAAPLVQARVPAEDAAPVKAHPSNHAEAIEWIVGGANRLREDDPYSPTAIAGSFCHRSRSQTSRTSLSARSTLP